MMNTDKAYFRLNGDCYLVHGNDGSAIYDVPGKQIYLIETVLAQVLRQCESNKPLNIDRDGAIYKQLLELQAAGLGSFEDVPCFVDKLLLRQPLDWKGMCMQPPKYTRVDWVITNECDLDCDECGKADETLVWQSCQSCVRHHTQEGNAWAPQDDADYVRQIAALGVRLLHIRGGNPLLAWERLQGITRSAQQYGLDVMITTPGTSVTPNMLLELYSRGSVTLNVVMFDSPEGQDDEDYLDLLLEQQTLVDLLHDSRLRYYVSYLLTPETVHKREQLIRYSQQRWQKEPAFSEIRYVSELNDSKLSHVDSDNAQFIPWQTAEEFYSRVKSNTCTYGNMELGIDGQLRACCGVRESCGDLSSQGLYGALNNDRLYQLWDKNKSEISTCQQCALRYACTDCTSYEQAGERNPNVAQAYCPKYPGIAITEQNWKPEGFVKVIKDIVVS